MKKTIAILILVFWVFSATGRAESKSAQDLKKLLDSIPFKHGWKIQPFFDSYELLSPFNAPFPVTTKSEPEAEMIIATPPEKIPAGTSMDKILKEQIAKVQKDLKIVEYQEKDYTPVNNMVSYIQKIGNSDVGFLQYRSLGEKGDKDDVPVTVKQALFVKGDQLYNIVLMILYPGHLEDVKSDQLQLVKALLGSKP